MYTHRVGDTLSNIYTSCERDIEKLHLCVRQILSDVHRVLERY